MKVYGVKLTHDGGIAYVEDGCLRFAYEMEKIENRPRHSPIPDTTYVAAMAAIGGQELDGECEFAVDGWSDDVEQKTTRIRVAGQATRVALAPYHEADPAGPCLSSSPAAFDFGRGQVVSSGYSHAVGHALSSYCTSPFAVEGAPAITLTWDGRMAPRFYVVRPATGIEGLGAGFPLAGNIYPLFAGQFPEFTLVDDGGRETFFSVSGKVMAYTALAAPREDLVQRFAATLAALLRRPAIAAAAHRDAPQDSGGPETRLFDRRGGPPPHSLEVLALARSLRADAMSGEASTAEALCAFQELIARLLVRVVSEVATLTGVRNLCLSGGCALNIKWNSRLRELPLIDAVWVPPFPSDSGSAIGAACAHVSATRRSYVLEWNVYRGPPLIMDPTPPGWSREPCPEQKLAELLATTGEPVVYLTSEAELGPRALGHRSILAPAISAAMKDRLNVAKGREWYRPVAPVCLEEAAPGVFSPGTPDPYMLFEHRVFDEWSSRIPAVIHLDGSARLQTVSGAQSPSLYRVLKRYSELTGIPVLCNTSANSPGAGFFPDVQSAARWGKIGLIWADQWLFRHAPGAPS